MLSLIIPVRDWPIERIEYCVESFSALNSRHLNDIVIVDFGSAEAVKLNKSLARRARLVRVEAPIWSLAEAINAGVLSSTNPVLVKTDADILISPDSRDALDRAVDDIAAGEIGLMLTQATDFDHTLSPAQAFEAVRNGDDRNSRLRPKWGQGGLVMFARSTWDAVGGFDARFTGWGNEDNDFAERVRRSGRRLGWSDREALRIFHVWHPPSYAATGVLKQRVQNQKIAKEDKSVLRPLRFHHSNFARLAAPAVFQSVSPLITLAVATTARPNRDRMILEAIRSFRGQADNDFEIFVLDNGSPAEATAALKRKLGAIRWAKSMRVEAMEQGSIPASRNAISRMARGRYICVVDDDDIALPNRLGDHLKSFEKDGLAHGSHGGWIDFDESTGVIERNTGKQRTIATLLKGSGKITAHPASFYRTDVMRAVPYDEAFALGSDFDLALRMGSLGFEIRHTHTFLTLRRYHSANVTITGQSNQVSNGLAARARAMGSFAWTRQKGIEEAAKKIDGEVYCRNQMSIDSLAELIPGYTGSWQIFVPLSALSRSEHGPGAAAALFAARDGQKLLPGTEEGDAPVARLPSRTGADADMSQLQSLIEIIDGDICTKGSGLNLPIFFRSVPINGLDKARRMREQIETLIRMPVQINSVTQADIDRSVAFDWKAIEVKPGERMLLSQRFASLTDLLVTYGRIDPAVLLRKSLSIMADHDGDGEAYYLVTRPVRGYDELRALRFELERTTLSRFRHVTANGVENELTLSARSH